MSVRSNDLLSRKYCYTKLKTVTYRGCISTRTYTRSCYYRYRLTTRTKSQLFSAEIADTAVSPVRAPQCGWYYEPTLMLHFILSVCCKKTSFFFSPVKRVLPVRHCSIEREPHPRQLFPLLLLVDFACMKSREACEASRIL